MQSSATPEHAAPDSAQIEQPVTTFTDENVGDSFNKVSHTFGSSVMQDTMLQKFFARPVKIDNFTWVNGAPTNQSLYNYSPWIGWAAHPLIGPKLRNYAFVRGTLKIKIVINSTPFNYGCLVASYKPLNMWPDLVRMDAFDPEGSKVTLTQRPCVYMYPHTNAGGEITCPFVWPADYLKVTDIDDFERMGMLTYWVYAPLQNAQGKDSTAFADVTVFAWMEDIELSGTTISLELQAGRARDEYGSGIVSKPASAVANIASKLTEVPTIGPFATAVSVGARAVASISSLFGFSTRPNLDNEVPMVPRPFPRLAATGLENGSEPLSLDPKAGISVNPMDVGDHETDNLNIKSLVTRDSYIGSFNWLVDEGTGHLKFTMVPNPGMYRNIAVTAGRRYSQTPMGMVAQLFQYWRGDIIVTLKVVASPYHKGRLLVAWDPQVAGTPNIKTSSDYTGYLQSSILDISESTTTEFRIPYHQPTTWLFTKVVSSTESVDFTTYPDTGVATTPLTPDTFGNGLFCVRVLNDLSAPIVVADAGTAPVTVMVFVRGAENLEFGGPLPFKANTNKMISYFTPQSGLQPERSVDLGETSISDNRYLVHMGEVVPTLRILLQRSNISFRKAFTNSSTDAAIKYHMKMIMYPPSPGITADASDMGWCQKAGGGIEGCLYAQMTPFTYLFPNFVGARGGIEWIANNIGPSRSTTFRISRSWEAISKISAGSTTNTFATNNTDDGYNFVVNNYNGSTGSAITSEFNKETVSAVVPFYSKYKFIPCHPTTTLNGFSGDVQTSVNAFIVDLQIGPSGAAASNSTILQLFSRIAPDFNFVYFTGAMPYYIYTNVPLAAVAP